MKQFCLTLSRPKHIFLSRLSCNNSRTNNYLSSSAPFHRRCFANSTRLDPSERDSLLESRLTNGSLKHNGNSFMFASWEVVADRDAIRKTFEFTNFNQAWGFMSQAALVAEKVPFHFMFRLLTSCYKLVCMCIQSFFPFLLIKI